MALLLRTAHSYAVIQKGSGHKPCCPELSQKLSKACWSQNPSTPQSPIGTQLTAEGVVVADVCGLLLAAEDDIVETVARH
mmetsp:Transcript_4061/g.8718  ORF Transcript_4061/g.8718 Transcript_4061/m.8718 type:complete len:80 (-) Transcript_4061:130-369(-)